MTPYGQLAVRRPADVPVDSLVRLMRSCEKNVTGAATCTRQDVLLQTGHPGHEENGWCLTGPGDEVLAWATLTPRGDVIDAMLTALPGRHGESAARTLLCLLLDRADELALERGRPYTVTVGGVMRGDPVVPAVLAQAGFERGATTGCYGIALTDPPPPTTLPDHGTLRPAARDDLGALHALHLRSRAGGPKTTDVADFLGRLRRLEAFGAVALILEVSGRPAGYVLAQTADGEGRIHEVAVEPAFRGRGIALALLTAALATLRTLGAVRAQASLDTGDLDTPETLARILDVRSARALTCFRQPPDETAQPS